MASEERKAMKEGFVSGLNGTTPWEINVIIHYSILLPCARGLLIVVLPSMLLRTKWTRFLVEYFTLVLPLVAVTTIFADYATLIFVTLGALLLASVVLMLLGEDVKDRKREIENSAVMLRRSPAEELLNADYDLSDEDSELLQEDSSDESFLTSRMLSLNHFPMITGFRSYATIISCICILAVDFHAFPRRLAKTECFGTSLMDTGVGFFVVGNGLVSPEARRRNRLCRTLGEKILHVRNAVITSWPLWTIGLVRAVSVKLVGYQEHVSEYGVHWNFFFTLAVVRIFSAFLLAFCSVPFAAIIAAITIFSYQILLLYPGIELSAVILNQDRDGFLMANKEGIFSSIGYIALYLAAVNLGYFVFKVSRPNVLSWVMDYAKLVVTCIVFWIVTLLADKYVQPISRRFANLAFVSWIFAMLCTTFVTGLLLECFGTFCVYYKNFPTECLPEQILLEKPKPKSKISFAPPPPLLCLIPAVNRNQLLYFLISNVATGVVNVLFDTMTIPDSQAFVILALYMFCNLLIIWILHMKQITVKFW